MASIQPFIKGTKARVMLAGDVHGNREQAILDVAEAVNMGARILIYAGDFGVGFRLAEDDEGNVYDPWSEFVSSLAVAANIDIAFVDGNHENFDYLETHFDAFNRDFPYEVAKQVWHIPRASVFSIANATFAAMGGAISVDRQWRTPGVSYWAQESISMRDMERFYNNVGDEPVDVLLTHDGPWTPVAHRKDYHTGGNYPNDVIMASVNNREYITELTKDFAPKIHAHGHMHLSYEYDFSFNTTVFGLARDEDEMSNHAVFLDIDAGIIKVLVDEDRRNEANDTMTRSSISA